MKKKALKEDVQKLISLGKSKGYLTYDEVNEALSADVDTSEAFDQVFDILDGKDIKVIESKDDEQGIKDESREQSIRRIRLRIESDPSNPRFIVTVRGYGYKLALG